MSDELWSVGDVALYLKLSTKSVYKLVNSGEITGSFRVGRSWYVHRQIFIDSLKQRALQTNKARPVRFDENKGRHNL